MILTLFALAYFPRAPPKMIDFYNFSLVRDVSEPVYKALLLGAIVLIGMKYEL